MDQTLRQWISGQQDFSLEKFAVLCGGLVDKDSDNDAKAQIVGFGCGLVQLKKVSQK